MVVMLPLGSTGLSLVLPWGSSGFSSLLYVLPQENERQALRLVLCFYLNYKGSIVSNTMFFADIIHIWELAIHEY